MLNRTGQKAWKKGHRLNGKLLGFKFGVWEGGHRVPFIAKWVGKIPAGTQSDKLISQIDLLATFAAITKQEVKEKTDSINQLPELLGKTNSPLRSELVILSNSVEHLSIRTKKWLYIPAKGSGGFHSSWGQHLTGGPAATAYTKQKNDNIEKGKWKKDAPSAQLYDLENDLAQTTNLVEKFPQVAKELQSRVDAHKAQIPEGSPKGWVANQNRKKK